MRKVHFIKLNELYCDAVEQGIKTAELRVNDRDYKVGDLVVFRSVSKADSRKRIYHPIDRCVFEITYVLSFDGLIGNGSLEYPWVMFCIKRVDSRAMAEVLK